MADPSLSATSTMSSGAIMEQMTKTEAKVPVVDAAAARLEQALARLEQKANDAAASQHLLRAECDKLNLSLLAANEKIARLRRLSEQVSTKLDRTIGALEALES